MKKTRNLVATLLLAVFFSSILFFTVSKITVYADNVDLTKNYWELTSAELEELTNRTSISNTEAQITVFTTVRKNLKIGDKL